MRIPISLETILPDALFVDRVEIVVAAGYVGMEFSRVGSWYQASLAIESCLP